MLDKVCEVCGSNHRVHFNSKMQMYLCNRHLMQIYHHGKILDRTIYDSNEIVVYDDYAEVLLYNKNGEEIARTKIDIDKIEDVKKYKWCFSCGYVYTNDNGKILLHRYIFGETNENIMIDHINRNRLDNRLSNLRIVTNQLNSFNASISKDNTSGVIGVNFHKSTNKWRAYINVNYKQIYLGIYENKDDAIVSRLKAELKYFGEFAPQKHLFKQYNIEEELQL